MSSRPNHNALPVGYQLHTFVIQAVLGQGGFGVTYLAEDSSLGRLVAIKEFLPSELAVRTSDSAVHPITDQYQDTFSWGLERFLSEARTLARFKHPNIVSVFSVFEANSTAYMVMEYEQGSSLEEAIRHRKLVGEAALLAVLHPLLDGLARVHEAGFIHRDIKPDNIFLRRDGVPVLLDFGSARQALGGETRTLTSLVTPGFAPFEQYNSTRENDRQGPWTDIYSLGATVHRVITGRGPIEAVTRADYLLSGDGDPFQALDGERCPGWSQQICAAVNAALQFRSTDRPQSIAEWLEMLPAPPTVDPTSPDGLVASPAPGGASAGDWAAASRRDTRPTSLEDTGPTSLQDTGPTSLQDTGPTSLQDTGDSGNTVIQPGRPAARWVTGRAGELEHRPKSPPPGPGDASGRSRSTVLWLTVAVVLVLSLGGGWWFLNGQPDSPGTEDGLVKVPSEDSTAKRDATAVEGAQSSAASGPASESKDAQPDKEAAGNDPPTVQQTVAPLPPEPATVSADQSAPGLVNQAASATEQIDPNAKAPNAKAPDAKAPDAEAPETEAERLETAARAEAARAEAERAELERVEAERAELAHVERARVEAARLEAERAGAEKVAAEQARATALQNQVATLLASAGDDLKARRLTTPRGNNAHEGYLAVLELAPGNVDATDGLQAIVAQYLSLAEKAALAGRYGSALSFLDRALTVVPNHPEVVANLEEVKQQQAVAAAKTEAEMQANAERQAVQEAERARDADRQAQAERDREVERLRRQEAAQAAGSPKTGGSSSPGGYGQPSTAAESGGAYSSPQGAAAAAPPSPALSYAIFPFQSIAVCFVTVEREINDQLRSSIQKAGGMLRYSYYGPRTGRLSNEDGLWSDNGELDVPAVNREATAMNVDVVLTAFIRCSDNESITGDAYRVDVHMVDRAAGSHGREQREMVHVDTAATALIRKMRP